jgi:hypothetical protein
MRGGMGGAGGEESKLAGTRKTASAVIRIGALLLLVASAYLVSGAVAALRSHHEPHDASLSFLAVGDTGKRHRIAARLSEGQIAVADAMALEDRHHPVDALVLLGDNFYMRGLERHELVPRLRRNLVLPYCRFLDLGGPRSSEVSSSCHVPESDRHVIPIHAVLGNHDHAAAESPRLQREIVPEFIVNWSMPERRVEVVELGRGVSLILVDSERGGLSDEVQRRLAEALSEAEGPWRVIAAHAPMAIGEWSAPPGEFDHSLEFESWMRSAIEAAGVAVHLYLSGHHHSMQVIEDGDELGPFLHVVVGSGARWREIENPHPRRRFGRGRLGFARVDLAGAGDREHLVVSLLQSSTTPLTAWGGPRLVSRWSIGRDGATRSVP